jgi:DNA (cytosine-5)-methyltransferase 1
MMQPQPNRSNIYRYIIPHLEPIPSPIPLTASEYFAGIGLVRLGLEQAGWKVVFANDISPLKYEMYQPYFKDAEQHYLVKDIFEVDPQIIPPTTLATSSFPCIDLSLAGNMNGIMNGRHSSAFWGFIKALKNQNIRNIAPPLVLVENVPGWLYSNKGQDFRVTVQALNALGYACDVFVLDARRFTPQSRLRVFLVGTQYPNSDSNPAKILSRSKANLTEGLKKAISANPDLSWNYIDMPEPPPLKTSGLANEVIESLEETDPRWWTHEKTNHHLAMMEKSHRYRVEELKNSEVISYRTFYRRIRNGEQRAEVRHDDIAGCLRTAVGGSSRQFILVAGRGRVRMRSMTPREYARLQGVPENYPINVDENQALTGFGDAVCVPAIAWIAQHALKPLVDHLASLAVLPPAIQQQ